MNPDKIYLLDANVFIESHKRYYAFDLSPGFWESIVINHNQNRLFSIGQVKKELMVNKDKLSDWIIHKLPATCFISTDNSSIINCYGQIQQWASNQTQFNPEAKAEFAENADCWLIACAKANSYVLVTEELLALDVKRNIPIPNVCKAFDVDCINTFELLRRLGVKLVLEK